MLKKNIALAILFGVCCTPLAGLAQQYDHHDAQQNDHRDEHHQQYVRHQEWRKGYHMNHDDWNRGERVDDYKTYHLRQPPRGYEWREVDGNYVMAAVTTGIIASVIAASAAH